MKILIKICLVYAVVLMTTNTIQAQISAHGVSMSVNQVSYSGSKATVRVTINTGSPVEEIYIFGGGAACRNTNYCSKIVTFNNVSVGSKVEAVCYTQANATASVRRDGCVITILPD